MILPERVFGRPGAHWITSGRGDRADLLADPGDQFLAQRFGRLDAGLQRDVGIDALALDVVREADHGRLGDFGVRDQRAFDLGGAHAVAGDVDHVIDPAGDPVIAVGVAARAVAGEIQALEGGEIGLHEALRGRRRRCASCPARLSAMQRLPSAAPCSSLALAVDQDRLDAGQRQGGGAGLLRDRARQRA